MLADGDRKPVRLALPPDASSSDRPTSAGATDAQLHEIALGMYAQGSLEETIERILSYSLSSVQCSHAALIMVNRRGHTELVASTDPIVDRLEEHQRQAGVGPDIDMVKDRLGVLVSDTRLDRRWPQWAAEAAGLGIRSMLGARLYTDEGTVGTLNLYDTRDSYFDVDDQAVANVLARHAAMSLARTRHLDNLWQAIDARKRIGQAQGILMERYNVNEDQAFQILLRYSQDQNLKLRVVAEELVASRALPGPNR